METTTPEKEFSFVEDLEKLIKEDQIFLRSDLRMPELCALLNIHRTDFSDYLKQVRRQCYQDFLSDYRVEYAQKILVSEPMMPIEQVYTISGFCSIVTFRRSFFKRLGTTPLRYRHIQQKRRDR